MTRTARNRARFLVAFGLIATLGVASAAYTLLKERAPVPFRDTYDVKIALSSAPGVVPGLGQPVNVAGVRVGSIVDTELDAGAAVLTLEIERKDVPRVYANAQAALDPVTPLGDVEINLDPGTHAAPALKPGATLGRAHTMSPVQLSALLSSLDADTREFLVSFVQAVSTGTRDRSPDLRKLFVTLGPTTQQLGQVSKRLAQRRTKLAELVHNLAVVTRAASQDGALDDVVAAGNATLQSVAEQDAPLRSAIKQLPATLKQAKETVGTTANFADELGPTVSALLPGVRRLPQTLQRVGTFSTTSARVLRSDVRPLVRRATPVASSLSPAVTELRDSAPILTRALGVTTYALNELAYNPPGDDEGGLFWLAWFAHNWNSMWSLGDAHGAMGRADVVVGCDMLQSDLGPVLAALTGTPNNCPVQ
jgi:phospholipid/cholesterol/gamma-HCH transport system substrate-binding protein